MGRTGREDGGNAGAALPRIRQCNREPARPTEVSQSLWEDAGGGQGNEVLSFSRLKNLLFF